mmetsp:Transcript_22914/g.34178  ORF Transcript_22914/g.34178 Transcript_22914/m.34178 type:complete len:297 (-) Transcript_22914:465-1355(-)
MATKCVFSHSSMLKQERIQWDVSALSKTSNQVAEAEKLNDLKWSSKPLSADRKLRSKDAHEHKKAESFTSNPFVATSCSRSDVQDAVILQQLLEFDSDEGFSTILVANESTSLKVEKNKYIPIPARRFCCNYCGKLLLQRSNAKAHVRIHTLEKPYPCRISDCNKAFKQSSNRKRHEKSCRAKRKKSKRRRGTQMSNRKSKSSRREIKSESESMRSDATSNGNDEKLFENKPSTIMEDVKEMSTSLPSLLDSENMSIANDADDIVISEPIGLFNDKESEEYIFEGLPEVVELDFNF